MLLVVRYGRTPFWFPYYYNMHVVKYGYQKGQKWKYIATEELWAFSVKSLSVKTPEVSEVEFYHFSKSFTTISYKSVK